MKFAPLPRSFYEPSAAVVARELLGHWLIRQNEKGCCGGAIVETEAYLCENDPASHGAVGATARNRSMWGEPGCAYVYYIYGNHHCVNAVCRPPGLAEAVLIRAVEVTLGAEIMRAYRPVTATPNLTNGPGKLCAAMNIDRKLDGVDLSQDESPLVIAQNPAWELFRQERGPIITTARIGITQATSLPLRFYLCGSAFISRRLPVTKFNPVRKSPTAAS